MIDPHRVAEAILDAAVNGGREVKVGALAHVNTALSKILPRLADRMSAARAGQQEHETRPLRPEGTLFRPGQSGQVYGVDKDGDIIPSQ